MQASGGGLIRMLGNWRNGHDAQGFTSLLYKERTLAAEIQQRSKQ